MQKFKIEKHLSFEYKQVELYINKSVQSLHLSCKAVLVWNSTYCCQILKVYEPEPRCTSGELLQSIINQANI